METYFESAEGVTITRERAIAEMAAHGVTDEPSVLEGLAESIVSLGDYYSGGTYNAQALLAWLGY